MATTTKAAKRPVTCAAMFRVDPTLGSEGCKRLPRHGGEHRSTLTVRQGRAAAAVKTPAKARRSKTVAKVNIVREIRAAIGQPRGRLNATNRRAALGLLSAAVDAGRVTAGEALGLVVRF